LLCDRAGWERSIRERIAQFFFITVPGTRNSLSNAIDSGFQFESQSENKAIAALTEVSAARIFEVTH